MTLASKFSYDATAPAVMMIHGMWCRPDVWDNFRQAFEARGYRVVIPTLRYHGPEYSGVLHPKLGSTSLLDYMADLEAEIHAMETPPLLIGHSMGGLLAQMLAARGLAQAAVMLASAHCAPLFAMERDVTWIFRRELFTTRFWRQPQLPDYETMRWGVLNGFSDEEAHALYAQLQPESGRALFEIALWCLDRRRASFVAENSLACPTLFLTGEKDRITPAWLAERNAGHLGTMAQFELLRGHAHWLPGETGWEHVADRCLRFFDERTSHMKAEDAHSAAA